jgi:hypothetical protein
MDLLYTCDAPTSYATLELRLFAANSSKHQASMFFEQSDRISFKGIWQALAMHDKSMKRALPRDASYGLLLYAHGQAEPIYVTSAFEWQMALKSIKNLVHAVCDVSFHQSK